MKAQWNEATVEKDIFNNNSIKLLSYHNRQNIFAVSYYDKIQSVFLSKDGGSKFEYKFNISFDEWGAIRTIKMLDEDTLLLITGNGIIKKALDIFHTPEYLIKYSDYDTVNKHLNAPSHFFLKGDSAVVYSRRIFKSYDNGRSWSPKDKNSAYGSNIFYLEFKNTFLSNTTSFLYSSDNYGNTWKNIFDFRPLIEDIFSGRVYDISFIDNNTGYTIVGTKVYKTTDGGYHWDSINHFDIPSINGQDVKFFNEKTGYAILSNSSKLYKTTDGGINWTSEFEFPSRFGNNKQLYYFGDSLFFILNDNKIFKRDKKQLSVEVTDSEPTAKVYPNPFNNIINIELSKHFDNTPIEYKVLDIQGKTIANGKRNDSSLNINLETLEKGIYFLQINNSNFFITKKILKN